MTRPSADPDWAETLAADPTTGQNNRIEPPTAWKDDGWSYQEKPPRNYDNWVKWNLGQWSKYHDEVILRTATYVVAANDSSASSKEMADYLCDGTDDQVQINAAITAVGGAGYAGGLIYLAEGTYNITAALAISGVPNVKIAGAGAAATILKIPNGTSATFNLFDIASASNDVTIRDLSIDGNNASATGDNTAINCSGSTGLTVHDVKIYGMNRTSTRGHGIAVVSTSDEASIYSCHISNCEGSGVYINSSSMSRVSNVHCEGCALACFQLGIETVAQGCVALDGTVQGFLLDGDHAAITGCIAKGCDTHGIEVTGDYVRVSGCRAVGNVNNGIYLNTTVHSGVVGCSAIDNTDHGIVLSAADRCIVSGCTAAENNNDGIRLNGSCSNSQVVGNMVAANSQGTHDTYYGINVNSADYCLISNNRSYQGTASPQQKYGLGGTALQSSNNNTVCGNDLTAGGITASLEAGSQSMTIPKYTWNGSAHATDSIFDANRTA